MGLGNDNGRFTYLNISKGKIAVKKEGVVHLWGHVEGWLKDIQIKDSEYQGKKFKQLGLLLDDGTESYLLQMKLNSGYGRAFCNMILNANLKLPIRIKPQYTEVPGENKTSGMIIDQDGVCVKWYYKNSDPKDRPPVEEVEVNGEIVPDNTKQQKFFIDLLLNRVRPTLDAAALEQKPEVIPIAEEVPAGADDMPADDLPF